MRNSPSNFNDITGQRFNNWTVLERVSNRWGRVHYLCRCDCGIEATVCKTALENGASKSCGCLKNYKKYLNKVNKKFGKRYSIADEFLIRQWYPTTGTKLLVTFLERSPEAIRHKARKMMIECKLTREEVARRRDEWSEDEIAILREFYPKGGTPACLPLLPNRSKNSIWTKVNKENIVLEKNLNRRKTMKWQAKREKLLNSQPQEKAILFG